MHTLTLWYTAENAFGTCKALGSVHEKTTMWDFKWDIFKRRYFGGPEFGTPRLQPRRDVQLVRLPCLRVCTHCGRDGLQRTWGQSVCHPYPWHECEPC